MSRELQALARTGEPDRYLAALFAPDEARPALFAIAAFDAEIRRIAPGVSEPQIGLIRQQWWLDSLEAGSTDHPVLAALAAARVPAPPLANVIRVREFDLYDDPMPDLLSLEGYLGETSSSLIQLACLLLDPAEAPSAAAAAGLAGVAYGLGRLLNAYRMEPQGMRKFLPRDVLAEQGEAQAVRSLVDHAKRRLAEARTASDNLSETLLPAFLPVAVTGLYLDRAARGRPGPPSQFRRQLAMWWAARHDRF